jgi:hypothetical protein
VGRVSKQRVREDTVGAVLAYVVAVAVLWLWPGPPIETRAALLIGMAVIVAVAVAVEWFAFKRPPRFGLRFRPMRYSLPAVPAFFGASALFELLNASDRPDRGVLAVAAGYGLILVGVTASNWWWANATDKTSAAPTR